MGLVAIMQKAEFEEKDFEGALYHQLAHGSPNLWTPGEVFEHHFGVDAALYSKNQFFLKAVNRSRFSQTLKLNHYGWGYIWRSSGKTVRMPSFEVNALLQSKRPQYLLGKNNDLATFGMSGAYLRFEIEDHQQYLQDSSAGLTRRMINQWLLVDFAK